MIQDVTLVLSYFSYYLYPATFKQLYTFYPKKISRLNLQKGLRILVNDKTIRTIKIDEELRYMLPRIKTAQDYHARYYHSRNLIHTAEQYLRLLKPISWIRYLGISGSLSMLNATQASDIDIFIITSVGSHWTARFIVLLYKKILCLLNPRFGYKLCFNLIFAQNGLEIAKRKQTEYVGHEMLQLYPIFNKSQTYEMFLQKNQWISHFFPNVPINSPKLNHQFILPKQSYFMKKLECLLRSIQKWWLDGKGYISQEERNQLWLIQKDYEDRLV